MTPPTCADAVVSDSDHESPHSGCMQFHDRADAGQQLAAAVAAQVGDGEVTVLGLPRGGMPVAAPVAKALGAPLDVLLVRKVGHPRHRELAVGAVAEGGVHVRNEQLAGRLSADEFAAALERAEGELAERARRYRGLRSAVPVHGRTVVVVDDGLATGATARVALQAVRERGPSRLVLAVPVGSPDGLRTVGDVADVVVCLAAPDSFRAVGQYYADFAPTSDDEVTRLLGG